MAETEIPTVYVIAGPNGAGKTTFAQQYLDRYANCDEFVNADLIAAALSPSDPESQSVAAARLMLHRMDDLTSARTTFGFETTLAGRAHARRLQAMKDDLGYRTTMFFIWLPSVEQAIARVAARVREGGHNIPEPAIRRRYPLGINNFASLYAPLLDRWVVLDGSDWPATKIASEVDGTRVIFDEERFSQFSKKDVGVTSAKRDVVTGFVRQADAAMEEAADVVLERARRHNTPIVVWRDGNVVELDPFSEQLDPDRRQPRRDHGVP